MHGPEIHQGLAADAGQPFRAGQPLGPEPPHPPPAGAIWLVSGIGEGPRLARALLARGWRLRVSVVGEAAGRAYSPHPALELQVGALAGSEAIAAALVAARRQGGFRWVVDGTHPFAERISADLLAACRHLDQPLLRLQRPPVAVAVPIPIQAASTVLFESTGAGSSLSRGIKGLPRRQVLGSLADLAGLDLGGKRLLLAIGARRLGEALAHSPAKGHFARILPNPEALALALAAGLGDGQLACLHPAGAATPTSGAIERALCRRWGIDAVLCRQSGGITETLWSELCVDLGLELLVLRQPRGGDHPPGLEFSALLEALGYPA